MSKQRRFIVGIILVTNIFLGANTAVCIPIGGSDHLKNLSGVKLDVVVAQNPGSVNVNIDRERVKTVSEIRLRRAGVMISDEHMSTLIVGVFLQPFEKSYCAFSVSVSLLRFCLVSRDEIQKAIVWERSIVGASGIQNMKETYSLIEDYVDQFVNDFLIANPIKEYPDAQDSEP